MLAGRRAVGLVGSTGTLDRPAPAPPASAGGLVPAGRRTGSSPSPAPRSPGRTPTRPVDSLDDAPPRPVFAVDDRGHACRRPGHHVHPVGGRAGSARLPMAKHGVPACGPAALRLVLAACLLAAGTATVAFAATQQQTVPPVVPPAQPRPRSRPSSSSRTCAARSTSSPRARSRTPASPGASRAPSKGYAANTVVVPVAGAGHPARRHGRADDLAHARPQRHATPSRAAPENASPYRGHAPSASGGSRRRVTHVERRRSRTPPRSRRRSLPRRTRIRRKPAFAVPGAPKEPLDEITLVARARALDAWVAKHSAPTHREREPLALPARLDRHRRRLRLVARRGRRSACSSASTARSRRAGASAHAAVTRPSSALAAVEARTQ